MVGLETIFEILAPFSCMKCSAEGALICDSCVVDAFPATPSRCYRCFASTVNAAVCTTCRKRTVLKNVWVGTEYTSTAKDLLWRLKFYRAKSAATVIASALDASLPYLPPDTLVVPVPTASQRVRARGYDHAELIARSFASCRSLVYAPLLLRMGNTRQVGAHRERRLVQLKDAFRVRPKRDPAGATILLVDDVVTTGATVETAAAMLTQSGAAKVYAGLFAQKR